MTDTSAPKAFVFTGFHMLLIMLAFFGTIISVNLLMAWFATTTWSGLVVKNTYVASQEFNAKAAQARAWQALGIAGTLVVEGSSVSYRLAQVDKGPLAADQVVVKFRRPVGEAQDFPMQLARVSDGRFEGTHVIPAGEWIVDLTSLAAGQTVYHEARRISVVGGAQ